MRMPVAAAALAAVSVLAPLAAGHQPAAAQDFSITNKVEPPDASRRDLMRQLQAWWDQHAFYPRRASQNDEGGTVKLRLAITPDGRIWTAEVVASSGSNSIDAAAAATFHAGFVRPFPAGVPQAEIDVTLRYVLAHRHDQAVAAADRPAPSSSPFTITNDPVKSPVLETMLQRTCTGTVVKEGIRNHPDYGGRYWAEAVFFRRPDKTPWVRFYEGGRVIIAPVSEVGKLVQWTGKQENPRRGVTIYYQYSVWADGDDKLTGNIEATNAGYDRGFNVGGTVDFACATQTVPAFAGSTAYYDSTFQIPSSDPP